MTTYLHIVATQSHGYWTAAYRESPHIGFGGEVPSVAIRRLLKFTGANVDVEEIIAIEDATRDGHLEFLIPYRAPRGIPAPSCN